MAFKLLQPRWPTLALVLILSAAAIVGISRLEFDDQLRRVLGTHDPGIALLEEFFHDFGSDDNDCVIVIDGADIFAPESVAALDRLVRSAEEIDGVASVRSIADALIFSDSGTPRPLLPRADAPVDELERARAAALKHPMLAGHMISEDARTTLVIVRLAGDSLSAREMAPHLQQLRACIEDATKGTGLRARLTGIPPVRVDLADIVRYEQFKIGPVAMLVAITLASLLFRRLAAVVIVLVAAATGVVWSLGALGLAGEKLNVLNNVLPTLVLMVGFTDAVHLIHHVRRERESGAGRLESARVALRRMILPCGLTSLTTAIGFGSLVMAGITVIQRLGVACAAGVMLSLLAVLTVAPLVASTRFGSRLERRHISDTPSRSARLCEAIAMFITGHARWVAVSGVVVTLLLAVFAVRIKADSNVGETIPDSTDTYQALQLCDRAFGGALFAYVLVDWSEDFSVGSPEVLGALGEAEAILNAEPLTRQPISVLNLLRSLPGVDADLASRTALLPLVPTDVRDRLVQSDRRRAIVAAHVTDAGGRIYKPVYARLEQRLSDAQSRYPGIRMRLTGTTVVAARSINRMITDLATSLATASLFIFAVIAASLRSIRFGLISILPNAFPLVFTAAFLYWLGWPLQMTSAMVFSICLGIAVDDTIHVLIRFKRELGDGQDVAGAVQRTFQAIGPALLTTSIVLVGGSLSIGLSDVPIMRVFAVMAAVALVAALLGDLVILPALLVCFVRPKPPADAAFEENSSDRADSTELETAGELVSARSSK